MDYISFDNTQLVNLDNSLTAELIRSNQSDCYLSTTISGCNTRKYHGLLIAPAPKIKGNRHVLLSSFDETVIQHGAEFNLGLHKYEGEHYEPNGNKYLREMRISNTITSWFRVGGVVLRRERMLVQNNEQMLIKYTLEQAHSPTTLRFKPFLAFRSIHALSHQNNFADLSFDKVGNGVKYNLYPNMPKLYMQFSKKVKYTPEPNWYNDIEYSKEKERGYEYLEDLLVPGYFELDIKKGESIIFSASTREEGVRGLNIKWGKEKAKKIPPVTYKNCLLSAASQFVQKRGDKVNIIAGYHWYGCLTRNTLVGLPGIICPKENAEDYEAVIDSQLVNLTRGLLPIDSRNSRSSYAAIDTPLWIFYCLQRYSGACNNQKHVWKKYKHKMKEILTAYKNGTDYGIGLNYQGLVCSDYRDEPLSWMNSALDGKPCVDRLEALVEVNALWYNALCYSIELAQISGDTVFVDEFTPLKEKVEHSFVSSFWSEEKTYLADGISKDRQDWSVRPNMIIAAAMEYSPLSKEQKKEILSVAKLHLLTPNGIRSLGPDHHEYKGFALGRASGERERIIHKGAAWPWLVQFFADAYLQVHGRGGVGAIRRIVDRFESRIKEHGIGTISEMYDGNPPYAPKGAISYMGSVASLIRTLNLLEEYEEEND